MTPPEQSPAERTVDVVVVGAGAAGHVAALRAREAGLDVVLLEAGDEPGGTTRRSSGGYWVPNNSHMRARGLTDPEPDAIRYMARVGYPSLFDDGHPTYGLDPRDHELLRTLYATTTEAVDWLAEHGHLRSTEMVGYNGVKGEFPSYQHLPEFDRAPYGRHLGPEYTEESAEAAKHDASRAQGHVAPTAGTQGDGRELWAQLDAAARREGVELLVRHRARRLITDDAGAVTGVLADTPDGPVLFRATSVVAATGGFSQDAALSDELLRGPIYGTAAVPTGVGDLLRMTEELDVELGNTENAWWAQVPLEPALRQRNMDWLLFVPYGDSMVIVDREGDRVVNEKDIYDRRGRAHFLGGAEAGWPNRVLMMVYDEGVARDELDWQPRWPVPLPGGRLSVRASGIDERELPISGATLEELAANIRSRLATLADGTGGFDLAAGFADRLAATIERFSGFARAGKDEDFGRGETPVELGFNGPGRPGSANPTMAPFRAEGPYHCILVAAGTLDTKGGPRIDPQARVLRADGTPIPGLYGAGNCVAEPTGEGYFSGGATLGAAIAFGWLAGTGAVARTAGLSRHATR
ncbi:FAD-dependent oxidoreductase [Patulibacter sp. NPDC049589]|uniref:FAD-dependent oxidoreductase n=1 Tax=Patulibacter sp. NPDC049589 TaxID=3154731 RepID=UPI00343EC5AD